MLNFTQIGVGWHFSTTGQMCSSQDKDRSKVTPSVFRDGERISVWSTILIWSGDTFSGLWAVATESGKTVRQFRTNLRQFPRSHYKLFEHPTACVQGTRKRHIKDSDQAPDIKLPFIFVQIEDGLVRHTLATSSSNPPKVNRSR